MSDLGTESALPRRAGRGDDGLGAPSVHPLREERQGLEDRAALRLEGRVARLLPRVVQGDVRLQPFRRGVLLRVGALRRARRPRGNHRLVLGRHVHRDVDAALQLPDAAGNLRDGQTRPPAAHGALERHGGGVGAVRHQGIHLVPGLLQRRAGSALQRAHARAVRRLGEGVPEPGPQALLRAARPVQPQLVRGAAGAGYLRARGEERGNGRHVRRGQFLGHPSQRQGDGRASARPPRPQARLRIRRPHRQFACAQGMEDRGRHVRDVIRRRHRVVRLQRGPFRRAGF